VDVPGPAGHRLVRAKLLLPVRPLPLPLPLRGGSFHWRWGLVRPGTGSGLGWLAGPSREEGGSAAASCQG
jgi:hypothetical protein